MARAAAASLALAAAAATTAAPQLLPLAWAPLPHGAVQPEGWLRRQLEIQSEGLSGNFPSFWPPVNASGWVGGNDTEEDWCVCGAGTLARWLTPRRRGCPANATAMRAHPPPPPPPHLPRSPPRCRFEIWPYVIQGYFPQAILLRDPVQLAQCETWVNHLLAVQASYGTGWMGIPLEKRDPGMTYWPQVCSDTLPAHPVHARHAHGASVGVLMPPTLAVDSAC